MYTDKDIGLLNVALITIVRYKLHYLMLCHPLLYITTQGQGEKIDICSDIEVKEPELCLLLNCNVIVI